VLGRPYADFVDEPSLAHYREAVHAVRGGVGCDVELDLRRKDGTIVRVLASCTAYRTKDAATSRIRMALVDISEIASARAERERVIDELQDALRRVKTLSGLVPICAWCRKVRADEGFYQQLEHYISEHTDAKFTHGICPECAKRIST